MNILRIFIYIIYIVFPLVSVFVFCYVSFFFNPKKRKIMKEYRKKLQELKRKLNRIKILKRYLEIYSENLNKYNLKEKRKKFQLNLEFLLLNLEEMKKKIETDLQKIDLNIENIFYIRDTGTYFNFVRVRNLVLEKEKELKETNNNFQKLTNNLKIINYDFLELKKVLKKKEKEEKKYLKKNIK